MSRQSRSEAICSEVAILLRASRLEKGLTTTEVARRSGLSQQMVSYVEKQTRKPTLDTLLRISDALEIDLANLLRTAKQNARK